VIFSPWSFVTHTFESMYYMLSKASIILNVKVVPNDISKFGGEKVK